MKQYRATVPEEEQDEIFHEVHKNEKEITRVRAQKRSQKKLRIDSSD